MRAIEQKIIEEVELSHGAIVTAAAYLNDEDYYICNLIDAHGDALSYEP
jgi:hypothetical protein